MKGLAVISLRSVATAVTLTAAGVATGVAIFCGLLTLDTLYDLGDTE